MMTMFGSNTLTLPQIYPVGSAITLSFPVYYYLLLSLTLISLCFLGFSNKGRTVLLFAYNCFLKPIGHSKYDQQQTALESFYKGQANIYDKTRATLLKGREDFLALAAAHFKETRNLVWIDYGGGTGWNIEQMNNYLPISSFKAIYLVDLSTSLCEVARKRFSARGWTNVRVVCISAHDFELPAEVVGRSTADFISMSYSLSMMPTYYALIDKISGLLDKNGIIGVVDFYVQSEATMTGATSTVGGEIMRHVNWFSRNFWRLWFEFDRVYLDSSRREYLEYRFGTVKCINSRNKTLGHIPYYIWLGCDKDYNSDLTNRIDALATESPYLSPVSAEGLTIGKNSSDIQQTSAHENEQLLRSKGYEVAVINMERNLPFPSFFYQHEIWRTYYDYLLPRYKQFGEQYIYAFTWEDPVEDIKILDLKPSDTVMAITSAGDNILAYAAMDNAPRRFHCVDLNPHQGHLMELKLAAIKALPYDDFWMMFGEGKHPRFKELLVNKLSKHMSSFAYQYWATENVHTFDLNGGGLYDTGSTRWALRLSRWLFKFFRLEKQVDELCKAKTMAEQKRIWLEKIRPVLFNPVFCRIMIANPLFLWKALGVPINQTSMIEGGILKYLVDTIEPLIYRSLISSDNYFYYLALQGRYSRNNCPAYLTKKGFFNLSKRSKALDGIRLHTDYISEVVERIRPGKVTCAIVMDHMDWFSPTSTEPREEIKVLHRALAVGGRVLLRSSSKKPWYIDVYESEGFECTPAAVRESGASIDRVNMYASTWVCKKKRPSKSSMGGSSISLNTITI